MSQDWHPEDIKAAIRKRGSTLAAIARGEGMSRQALAMTLVRPGEAGEGLISAFLNVPASVIWPSRYHASGKRKRPQPAVNYRFAPRFSAMEAHR